MSMKKISRRDFLKAAGVVAASGALTACGGSAASSSAAAGSGSAASEQRLYGQRLAPDHDQVC